MAFDPTSIERHALALHQKAGSRVARFTIFGVLIGAALGASAIIAPMVSSVHSLLPHRYAYAAVVMGAAAGAYLGYLMGQSRAVALRLQANVAVHQVEIGRALHRIEAMRLPLPGAASLPTPAPTLAPAPTAVAPPPQPTPVVSLPPAPPPALEPAPAPAPAPMPMHVPMTVPVSEPAPTAYLAPYPVPEPAAQTVPPTYERLAPPTSNTGS
jgi:hypothetical protein